MQTLWKQMGLWGEEQNAVYMPGLPQLGKNKLGGKAMTLYNFTNMERINDRNHFIIQKQQRDYTIGAEKQFWGELR